MLHLSDEERRRRLMLRHGLARPYPSVEAATEAMGALHATEAATVHLALWARVEALALADVERALYDDRSVVKQLAMRRTLFGFRREMLPAVWGSAAARVARQQRQQVGKDLLVGGQVSDPDEWIETTLRDVLAVLSDGEPRSTAQLRELVPALATRVSRGSPGKKWAGEFPIGPNVMTLLGAQAQVVRGPNAGHWRLNKPTWVRAPRWLEAEPEALGEREGYAELVRCWLATFGPGTETDIVWWLGATKTIVRRALADLAAVQVGLERGATGWVLPDDTDPVGRGQDDTEPRAALLPSWTPP